MDASPPAQISPNATGADLRPNQPGFSETQQEFLREYLDEYLALTDTRKGGKKNWVKSHVYPKYVDKFKSNKAGGPNLSSLFEVSARNGTLVHCITYFLMNRK